MNRTEDDDDDLFDKLDQLISRHQARSAPAAASPVPTLTEAVDQGHDESTPEIPLLEEAIEPPPEWPAQWPTSDRRRQLQVALYLRLRQRLDKELEALAQGRIPAADAELMRAVQALRDALPAIIRDSVEQVLGSQLSAASDQLSGNGDGADGH
ncbi:MAG TPA: hypothetical protein VFU53_12235 [Burkholderiales bacterium]|nr:hypothetical protein [Burkholderiales bacterium]